VQIPTKEDFEALSRKIDALRQDLQGATIIPAPEWVCIKEAARRKGVTEDTVRRWIRDGQIEARGAGRLREVRL